MKALVNGRVRVYACSLSRILLADSMRIITNFKALTSVQYLLRHEHAYVHIIVLALEHGRARESVVYAWTTVSRTYATCHHDGTIHVLIIPQLTSYMHAHVHAR